MDTTKLIVEYLLAGTLIVVSTLFAIVSWFPSDVRRLLALPNQQPSTLANQVILATVFIAFAYGAGIVSEYVGEKTFEWLLDLTKRRRMSEYVETYAAIMKNSPILASIARQPKEERDLDKLADCIGKMRFFVMNHSAPLYAEIAAQISRFRLFRVLFLAEAIALVAMIGRLRSGFTILWLVVFAFIVAIAAANFMAIRSRFKRYCRAVERSYLVLMYEQVASQETGGDSLTSV